MRPLTVLVLFAIASLAAEPKAREWTLKKEDFGELPAGWTAAKTGKGDGSVWKVTADNSAPGKTGHVLTQTAEGPNRLFNLCLVDGSEFADGELSVRAKSVSGEIDQGGGLVWRAIDGNNYYICRYNPLEKNFRLYQVKDGRRTELASKDKLEPLTEPWFTVAVKHAGNKITCSLNGKHTLEITNDTFAKPGKVGFWTKADAVTSFDQLKIVALAQ
jgi:hypothetical protein